MKWLFKNQSVFGSADSQTLSVENLKNTLMNVNGAVSGGRRDGIWSVVGVVVVVVDAGQVHGGNM